MYETNGGTFVCVCVCEHLSQIICSPESLAAQLGALGRYSWTSFAVV